MLESFKYRFLVESSKLNYKQIGHNISWKLFLENLNIEGDNNFATIFWNEPSRNSIKIDLRKFIFYGNNSGNIKTDNKKRKLIIFKNIMQN